MSDQLQVPPAVLDSLRSDLTRAAAGLEDTASSAPRSVDAGDMQAMITGMLARVVDNTAAISEALTAISGQVRTAEADFWAADAAVAEAYRGKELPDGS